MNAAVFVVTTRRMREAAGERFAERRFRVVTPISHSRWNDGFAADSGASRGDLLTRAICPSETSPAPLAYDRPRPFVVLQDWAYYRAESERKRSSVRLGVLV
jgi:hypothetical protein